MKSIQQIVDTSLEKMQVDYYPMRFAKEDVPKDMVDVSVKRDDDNDTEYNIGWKAIESTITDTEIEELEKKLGHKLPLSYKLFLQYKYFLELHLEDYAIRFNQHDSKNRLDTLRELNFEMNIPEEVIGKGYIYFADFDDHMLLCFDANKEKENNEYEIVAISHDNFDNIHFYAANFEEFMNFDGEQSNRFIEKLNDFYDNQNN